VAADNLATKSVQFNSTQNTFNELTDAYMQINNLLVTHNYKTILRQNHLSVDLRKYLREANNWQGSQTENIWWSIHKSCINDLSKKKRRFIQKFIHKNLPCNYRQQKFYTYKSSICMSCKEDIKTQDHIFRCISCSKRTKLKAEYVMKLSVLLDNHRTNDSSKILII
jgi:hypothetical protein